MGEEGSGHLCHHGASRRGVRSPSRRADQEASRTQAEAGKRPGHARGCRIASPVWRPLSGPHLGAPAGSQSPFWLTSPGRPPASSHLGQMLWPQGPRGLLHCPPGAAPLAHSAPTQGPSPATPPHYRPPPRALDPDSAPPLFLISVSSILHFF